jgi:hypothetical protein
MRAIMSDLTLLELKGDGAVLTSETLFVGVFTPSTLGFSASLAPAGVAVGTGALDGGGGPLKPGGKALPATRG